MPNATATATGAAAIRNGRFGPFMQLMIPLSWVAGASALTSSALSRFPYRAPASDLRGRANAMIFKLFRRTPRDTIACLYGTIVAQARLPAFYQIYGVPDTVNGRLEMIMLHTVLFLRRLCEHAGAIRAL